MSADVAQAGEVAVDPLAREVARAQTAAALFGRINPVTVGRYQLLERLGAGGMGVVWSAFDPELGRPVALKLASSGSAEARTRARTEGRALARLSHPHVVPIYDVVEAAHGVFLVMELVRGATLRQLVARDPGPRAIITAYREAALGLAAAHAAGLVHRDFKPDNAVVGADQRVRVLDFGLAHDHDVDGAPAAGTPAYMAPEQRAGAAVPASDQYALCVSLREALGDAAPRWLLPILARGTAEDPAARFPSMSELEAALGRDPRAVWRRRGIVGLALAAIAVGVVVGRGPAAAARTPRCDGGAALIAESWDRARAARVAHLGSLTGPYAPTAQAELIARLDDYARRWQLAHRAACQAHVRAELSTALFDRRIECLARGRTALATVGRLADDVTPDQLPGLVEATAALPELARCSDDGALAVPVAPPPPALAARVSALELQLAELAVLRDAGRIDEARTRAAAAVAEADAIGYPPLTARAYLARGRIALTALSGDRGAPDFAVATRTALAAGDDVTAVEAFARQAFAAATGAGDDRTVDGRSLIEPIAARLDRRGRFAQALLEGNLAAIALAADDRATARDRSRRAIGLADELTGAEAAELTFARYLELLVLDDPAALARQRDALIALRVRQLGATHPATLIDRGYVALFDERDAAVRAQLEPPCRELATRHPSLRDPIGECSAEAALLAALAGDQPSLRAWSATLSGASGDGALPVMRLRAEAFAALAAGDARAALTGFRAARARLELTATTPSWVRILTVDLALAGAAAARAASDRAALDAEVAVARAQLALTRASMPAAMANRRAAELDALAPPAPR